MHETRYIKVNIERRTLPIMQTGYSKVTMIVRDKDMPFTNMTREDALKAFGAETDAHKALSAYFKQPNAQPIGVVGVSKEKMLATELEQNKGILGDGYYVTSSSQTDEDIKVISEFMDGQKGIALLGTSSIELAEEMAKAASENNLYLRTNLMVHDRPEQHIGSALAGMLSSKFFGTHVGQFKQLVSVDPIGLVGADDEETGRVPFTHDDEQRITKANANTYWRDGGFNVVSGVKLIGGEFMDVYQTEDYIANEISKRIHNRFMTYDKIDYTDEGIDVLHSALIDTLLAASARDVRVLARDDQDNITFKTNAKRRREVDVELVKQRIYDGLSFIAVPTGHIGAAEINGVITFDFKEVDQWQQ